MGDFLSKSQTLKLRFMEKGYKPLELDADIQAVSGVDRNSLLADCPKVQRENHFKWSFFTSYSIQHNEIKKILNKHWKVLLNDRVLGLVLPDRTGIIFRGAHSILGEVAPTLWILPGPFPFTKIARGTSPAGSVMFVNIMFVADSNLTPFFQP